MLGVAGGNSDGRGVAVCVGSPSLCRSADAGLRTDASRSIGYDSIA